MIIVFFIWVLLIGLLYTLSKNKYQEIIEPLDKKSYSFKDIIPIGLYILDKINYRFTTKYDRRLYVKFTQLYGHKDALYYLKIHWASKIAYLMISLMIVFLFGAGMENIDAGFIVFALIIVGLVLYQTDKEIDSKLNKRHMLIQLDFPDFLNKLTLLVNAGMTVSRAWEKIVLDSKSDRPLYHELKMVYLDIKSGKSQQDAYEEFAKRCQTQEVTKFVSVILQNLRKGSTELVPILRLQARDCWEMRKNAAKKLGEEAGTKLLLPIMLMFVAVLIIVITPAVLQLNI